MTKGFPARRRVFINPPRLTPAQKAEARRRRAEGATLAELARSYDVSRSTISRLAECRVAQGNLTPTRSQIRT